MRAVKKGGARHRWKYAVGMTVRIRRVVEKLRESREQRRTVNTFDAEADVEAPAAAHIAASRLPHPHAAAIAAAPAGRCNMSLMHADARTDTSLL